MRFNRSTLVRSFVLISLIASLTGLSTRLQADTGSCGGVTITLPFNDVMVSPFFCQIAAVYYSGLTNGTTATTYSPTQSVTREHMAAFISRNLDQSLKRSSRKAVTKKWWTPKTVDSLTLTDVGISPRAVAFDGTDLWVANNASSSVTRVRPSDGKPLETWTGAVAARDIVCAMGKIFITGSIQPGALFMIDPTQKAANVITIASGLGSAALGIAFDGSRIWTTNGGGSVSIISFNPTTVTTITPTIQPNAILYDGSNIWVTDTFFHTLIKLDSNGGIVQTIQLADAPQNPVFDGTNIWVPMHSAIEVVRVKDNSGNPLETAFVLTTLTGNGLIAATTAAFDGERILITNSNGNSVSMWKAADLTPLGTFATGGNSNPFGVCSDGLNFWITLNTSGKLARF